MAVSLNSTGRRNIDGKMYNRADRLDLLYWGGRSTSLRVKGHCEHRLGRTDLRYANAAMHMSEQSFF